MMDEMSENPPAILSENVDKQSAANLKHFVSLAESASGLKLVEVIKQTLESPTTYVFGELLDIPNVKELANTEYSPYLTLLNLFAYGTYRDYVKHRESNSQSLPELTEPMVTKLKFLSIVSLARFNRRIPYSVLMQELDTNSMRQLEDLLIDAVYADVIKATMDQESNLLEVDETISRDVKEEDFQIITNILSEWCRNCDNMLSNIEQQISMANQLREESITAKQNQESRIAQIKKNPREMDDMKDSLKHDTSEKKRASLKQFKNIYKGGINKSSRKD